MCMRKQSKPVLTTDFFYNQISDDERMSLTTAISDDEIDHSSSPVSTRPINSAASFNCTGAVRKAGFLSVKKWIIRKKHKVHYFY
jgi:T-lymphoma invasion and metastasis-inducing protein 1